MANPKFAPYIFTTKASITIVDKTFVAEQKYTTTLLRVDNAYEAFSKLLEYYNQVKMNKTGVEDPVFVSKTASLGDNIYLGAFAYIGDNVIIGDNCLIFSGVKIYSETEIGNDCTFHSGCVIGSDGFGFSPNEKGEFTKIPQIGNVVIENNVDIGSSSTIDRATLGSTILRSGVKLDNQVQIAHNVEIGKNTAIAAQSGIAGSTKVGEGCMIGGQVGISGHLNLGNYLKIQAQSGISKNLKDYEVVQGSPAFGYSDYNKSYVYFKNLPKLANKITEIEKKINTQNSNDE